MAGFQLSINGRFWVSTEEYTNLGGRIEVSLTLNDEGAVIRVRDDGIGIPADLLPNVFDLFRQAPRGPDRAGGGLGLGLTIVRRLIELHEGRVEAKSEKPVRNLQGLLHLRAQVHACPLKRNLALVDASKV